MRTITIAGAFVAVVTASQTASAVIVGGGGSAATDCVAVFDAPGANSPAPPKAPKNIDCTDGDSACDADGLRNGSCVFDIRVCINSNDLAACSPQSADSVDVAHSDDNGDSKFDPDFQAIQQRVDLLGFPGNTDEDSCTTTSAISVPLKAPSSGNVFKKNRKRLSMASTGLASGRPTTDRDKMKMTCQPEGDGVYLPTELYTGTFDRIRNQIFAQSCALSGCHDSESHKGNMILYPNVAYSQIVGVTPDNDFADADGLERIMPGDPNMSFLYRKITHDLLPDYGDPMPLGKPQLSSDLTEIVRLWILGDMTVPPASSTGWVEGTDQ